MSPFAARAAGFRVVYCSSSSWWCCSSWASSSSSSSPLLFLLFLALVLLVVVVGLEGEEEEEEVVVLPQLLLPLVWPLASGVDVGADADVAAAAAAVGGAAAAVVVAAGGAAEAVKGGETQEVSDKGKAERTLSPITCLRALTPLSVLPQRETHAEGRSGMSFSLMHAIRSWASTVSTSSSPLEASPL